MILCIYNDKIRRALPFHYLQDQPNITFRLISFGFRDFLVLR